MVTRFKYVRTRLESREADGCCRMKSGTIVLAHCTPNNSDPEHVTGWITKFAPFLLSTAASADLVAALQT